MRPPGIVTVQPSSVPQHKFPWWPEMALKKILPNQKWFLMKTKLGRAFVVYLMQEGGENYRGHAKVTGCQDYVINIREWPQWPEVIEPWHLLERKVMHKHIYFFVILSEEVTLKLFTMSHSHAFTLTYCSFFLASAFSIALFHFSTLLMNFVLLCLDM